MSARIYIGNLPIDIRESELDDLFYKYGRIRDIDLKTPSRPPAFAFITFEDGRDAEDAVRARDGYNFDGNRLRCEFAHGDRSRGVGGGREDRVRGRTGGRRTEFGVQVSNLPRGCSWQDLKDFMRKAGDVVYTDVERNGEGVVEFSNREDMEYAIKSLDDTEFKNFNESTYIRIKSVKKGGGRSEEPLDRDRGARKSSRRDSRSRSRSRSPALRGGRSPSRSRSRSPAPRGRDSGAGSSSSRGAAGDRSDDEGRDRDMKKTAAAPADDDMDAPKSVKADDDAPNDD